MTSSDENSVIASILAGIGAPDSQANAQSLADWIAIEQGGKWPPSASFNPMNTTQAEAGATDFNSVGVKNYTSWTEGISATDATLQNGLYPGIVASLVSGGGLLNPNAAVQSELLKWSGGGYSTVASGAGTAGTAGTANAATGGSSPASAGCPVTLLILPFILAYRIPLVIGHAVSSRVKWRRNMASRQRANRKDPR